MVRVLVYLMEAPRTRLLGLEAPKYTPFLMKIEVDLRVVVEDLLGNLLDVGSAATRTGYPAWEGTLPTVWTRPWDRAYLGGDRGPVATLQPEHPARLIRRGDFQ
jgi:hypothetical protein